MTLSAFWLLPLTLGFPDAHRLEVPQAEPVNTRADETKQDPILALRDITEPPELLRSTVEFAVTHHPLLRAREANRDEADLLLDAARKDQGPSGEFSLQYFSVIDRQFSDDPQNLLERARPAERTDAILSLNQTVIDFGAGASRVRAASARARAASAEIDAGAGSVALNVIAAWHDLISFRQMLSLYQTAQQSTLNARELALKGVSSGTIARMDLSRVDTQISQNQIAIFRIERQLARAEARFEELTGRASPAKLQRVPVPGLMPLDLDEAIRLSRGSAQVQIAEAEASALRYDSDAARSDLMPRVTAGVDAGRYGVLENERDYDIRGRVTLRYQFFGGVASRADSIRARSRGASWEVDRIRQEAERDAAIAWNDVKALESQLDALESAYVAVRTTRDTTIQRFRVLRGALFDAIAAENALVNGAIQYMQGLFELDVARYILLSRTGLLLRDLEITDPSIGPRL